MVQIRKHALRKSRGFTLVELLIVVIILAILAAIVVPQFIASTQDAEEAAVDTNLRNLRAAIDLYFQQHGEYPSANGDGVNPASDPGSFVSQLTMFTDADGVVSPTKTGAFVYGPYLRSPTLPKDPVVKNNAVVIATTGTLPVPADGTDPGGWKFDNVNGQIIVNHATYANR